MADSAKDSKKQKSSWFKGLKAEFGKISWSDKETVAKQTVAVVAMSLFLGVVIAVLDLFINQGIKYLVG